MKIIFLCIKKNLVIELNFIKQFFKFHTTVCLVFWVACEQTYILSYKSYIIEHDIIFVSYGPPSVAAVCLVYKPAATLDSCG